MLFWKIVKTVFKVLWKVLRLLLFRCGLIFVALYVLIVFLVDLYYKIGLCPGGAMEVWYYVGLSLSVVCTAILIVLNATRRDRQESKKKNADDKNNQERNDRYSK